MIRILRADASYFHCMSPIDVDPERFLKRRKRRWGFQLGTYRAEGNNGTIRVKRVYLNYLPRKKLFDLSLVCLPGRVYLVCGSSLYTERLARAVLSFAVNNVNTAAFVVAGRGKVGRAVARSLSTIGPVQLVGRAAIPHMDLSTSMLVLATDASTPVVLPKAAASRAPIVVSVGNKTSPVDCEVNAATFGSVQTDNQVECKRRGFTGIAPMEVLSEYPKDNTLIMLFQDDASEFREAYAFVQAWENTSRKRHVPGVVTTSPSSDTSTLN